MYFALFSYFQNSTDNLKYAILFSIFMNPADFWFKNGAFTVPFNSRTGDSQIGQ